MKTLSCKGFSSKDQLVLKSLIDLIIARTSDTWTYSDGDDSDVVIIDTDNLDDHDAVFRHLESRHTVAIEYTSDTTASSRLRLQKPLRAANLISVFNSVEARIANAEADESHTHDTLQPLASQEPTPEILTALDEGQAKYLSISAGDTTCFIDLPGNRYTCRGDLTLPAVLGASDRTVSTTPQVENLATTGEWRPYPALRWLLGTSLSNGELLRGINPNGQFKLHHWPPAEVPRAAPYTLSLCALLSREAGASIEEAGAQSGVARADIIGFINGAYLARAITTPAATKPTGAPVATEADTSAPSKPRGLFGKIRDRLMRKAR
ncbi:hypothetical protein KUV44_13240 [Marinobacter daepoensis]|uniref:Uncharacterized protein n=1 Tax=Marinobacter daepoensis TaxID=262077 RepID=A0ABS3BI42_9GAMM|nr:hypothetical protein [Marinobacter daepoensis]MBN7771510.1 hypothetical protein [Marinobacter daepoensis]MBY6034220.1 hypothetical protein [Marinobacter daepoensis]MBY6080110.1 hypothetical protein [Marinobacter daepoensis]